MMKAVLILTLSLFGFSAFAANGYQASNGEVYPWCTSDAIDPDNDGWGWENEASCKVLDEVVAEQPAPANGVDELPIKAGLPTYGEGRTCGRFGVVGEGRGRVCCNGDFFADEDEDEVTWVARTAKGRYFADAGSSSCARAKVILRCSFQNPLAVCESAAKKWY